MTPDAVLFYADDEEGAGGAICKALEENGIQCWMASRDVPPGEDPREAAVLAITSCELIVVIFSPRLPRREEVGRLLGRLCERGLPVIAVCLGETGFPESIRYLPNPPRVFDASTPPLEDLLPLLVVMAKECLPAFAEREAGVSPSPRGKKGTGDSGLDADESESDSAWEIRFTVEKGPHAGKSFSFSGHETFICGRGIDAHLRISDKFFSRHHFMVEVNPPYSSLVDLESTNGTAVNGRKATQVNLEDGDTIEVGPTVIRFSIEPGGTQGLVKALSSSAIWSVPDHPLPAREERSAPGKPIGRLDGRGPPAAPQPIPRAVASGKVTGTPPSQVAQYRISRELGRGGMGAVYQARDTVSDEKVALKTIASDGQPSSKAVRRFLREASILQELAHPNIVRFLDMGVSKDVIYIVMEYVEGSDADHLISPYAGRFPVGRAVRLVCQLLEAIDYAHAKGFVHRDIKPSNLIVTESSGSEAAVLTDFGLGRVYQSSRLSGISLSGEVGGTAIFMAPEQITDFRNAQPPADLYATGATLYFLLTGKYTHDFPPRFQRQLIMVLDEEPIPILSRRKDIPPSLAAIVHQSLAKEPENRFTDTASMRQALLPFCE